MIETLKFKLSPNKYYIIIMRIHYKRFWWLYTFLLIAAVIFMGEHTKDTFDYFIIFFGFFYLPFNAVHYYIWATSKKNKLLFTERTIKFDEDKLFVSSDVGTYSEIPL